MRAYWKNLHLNSETLGLIYGFLGVVGFSLTLPATRAAVIDLDPLFVGLGRGLVAAILAAFTLRITHQPIPSKQQLGSLLVVGLGVVLGFPVLSAWAMQQVPAAHGAVVLGVLPLATAISCYAAKPDKIALPLFLIFRSHLITISPSFNNLCSNSDNSSTDLNSRCAIYSFAECQTNSIKL